MVRYFRRRFGRRYYKRNRRLSKANIYGNRSARSQAGQIAALNRKINNVAKRTKPEYHIVNSSSYAKSFTSGAFSSTYIRIPQPVPSANSASDSGFVGDMCHMLSLTLHGYCEYFNNS